MNTRTIIRFEVLVARSRHLAQLAFLIFAAGLCSPPATIKAQETSPALVPDRVWDIRPPKPSVCAGAKWGKPIQGYQVGLVSEKTLYVTGEELCVTICMSNTTSQALFLATFGWRYSFDFTVVRLDGKAVELTERAKRDLGPEYLGAVSGELPPGQVFEEPFYVNHAYDLSAAGEYDITVIRYLPKQRKKTSANSGTLRIKIVAERPKEGPSKR